MSKYSDEEARRLLDELSEHFGEKVRPVSEYCNAFYDWGDAIKAALDRGDFPEYEIEGWTKVVKALDELYIPIHKSNYLWRRIYGDGHHRTEKCPEHKGHWSGYFYPDPCKYGCCHGYDITGWLPPEHEYVEPPADREPVIEDGEVVRVGIRYVQGRCYTCGGTREDGRHKMGRP